MEEQKKRSVKEIQAEYTQLCAKAGHLQYAIYSNQKDLALVNESLRNLNIEAAQSAKNEAADSPKQEEAKS